MQELGENEQQHNKLFNDAYNNKLTRISILCIR